MTIADIGQKCKSAITKIPRDVRIVSVLVLASGISFLFGFLAGKDTGQGSDHSSFTPPLTLDATTSQIVASRFGKNYYLTTCAGANRITPANKVFFASTDAARAAGYTKAGNCAGL